MRERTGDAGEPDPVGAAGCVTAIDPATADCWRWRASPRTPAGLRQRDLVRRVRAADLTRQLPPDPQPLHPGHLCAGLDVQGDHRPRGRGGGPARPRQHHPGSQQLGARAAPRHGNLRSSVVAVMTSRQPTPAEFGSTYTGGERTVGLAEAISVSSDVFFYKLAGEGFWQMPRGRRATSGSRRRPASSASEPAPASSCPTSATAPCRTATTSTSSPTRACSCGTARSGSPATRSTCRSGRASCW